MQGRLVDSLNKKIQCFPAKKWNMASSELGIDIMNITGKTGIA